MPEMKLFAWLCIAWRPPLSDTFTHISFNDHPMCSPNSTAPKSASSGVMNAAASTRSGLSAGRSMAVCTRLADELFAWPAAVLKCLTRPAATRSRPSAPGTRMKGVGKSPMTSCMDAIVTRRRYISIARRRRRHIFNIYLDDGACGNGAIAAIARMRPTNDKTFLTKSYQSIIKAVSAAWFRRHATPVGCTSPVQGFVGPPLPTTRHTHRQFRALVQS